MRCISAIPTNRRLVEEKHQPWRRSIKKYFVLKVYFFISPGSAYNIFYNLKIYQGKTPG